MKASDFRSRKEDRNGQSFSTFFYNLAMACYFNSTGRAPGRSNSHYVYELVVHCVAFAVSYFGFSLGQQSDLDQTAMLKRSLLLVVWSSLHSVLLAIAGNSCQGERFTSITLENTHKLN